MATAVARPSAPQFANNLSELLSDRALVERELQAILPTPTASPVSACMEYAVMGEGQRLRPLLAIRSGNLLGSEGALTLRAAAATELLHCASLIVDDLPCMDNDATRRNRPSAHIAYGESTALLAAFGLVALAARTVIEQEASEAFWGGQRRFQISLLSTLDCASLIGGQVMDLELSGVRREQCRDLLNDLKTVPLFVLSVEAAVAYAPSSVHAGLKQFGRHFGVALQMADDYLDGEAPEIGPLEGQLALTKDCLAPYGAAARPLEDLVEYLHARAQDYRYR